MSWLGSWLSNQTNRVVTALTKIVTPKIETASGDGAFTQTQADSAQMTWELLSTGGFLWKRNGADVGLYNGGNGWWEFNNAVPKDAGADDLGFDGFTSKRWRRGYINQHHVGTSAQASNYTITSTDGISVVIASGVGTTITLPSVSASGGAGRKITIKRNDAANAITIDGAGAETIDGAATKSLDTDLAFITVVSDGGQWFIIGQEGTVT